MNNYEPMVEYYNDEIVIEYYFLYFNEQLLLILNLYKISILDLKGTF